MAQHFVDDDRHLRAAIDHALHNRPQAAAAELTAITRKGPDRTYRLWQSLAETAIWPIRYQPPGGPRYGLAIFDPYAGVDLDDLPPHISLAMRFLGAQATRDRDRLETLFHQPLEAGFTGLLEDTLGVLLDAAVESARAQQAHGTSGPGGTFGHGQ